MNDLLKKKLIFVPLILALVLQLFAGCGTNQSDSGSTADDENFILNMDTSPDAIENLSLALVGGDLSTQNPHHSCTGTELRIFGNLYEGLTVLSADGEVIPAMAEYWEHNEDYSVWTFHLRDDIYWVDYKSQKRDRVRADDFVTGLEWIANYWKNGAETFQMTSDFIAGAADYLTMTEEMTEEEALALTKEDFLSAVGIEAPDENTVVYHLTGSCVFFPSILINVEFLPLSQTHLDELGVDGYLVNSYYDAWFNGPYLMTEFIPSNELIMDANPYWYGNDEHTRFRSVTAHQVESASVSLQLYENNEVDMTTLYQSQINAIVRNPGNPYYDSLVQTIPDQYQMQILFNYRKNKEDGSADENWNRAAASEAFRLSWYYGLNLTSYLAQINPIDPLACEATTVTADNLVTLSDGTDYADLVRENIGLRDAGETGLRKNDADLFEKCKAQAIEELTSQGVTFPIQVDYYIKSSSQGALDDALVLKDCMRESFGDDYIVLNILSYTSSYYTEVVLPKKDSFVIAAWGADYGDPNSILAQYKYRDPNAYETDHYMHINEYTDEEIAERPYLQSVVDAFLTYNDLCQKAQNSFDTDERYTAFAEAEAHLLSHGLVIPVYFDFSYCLTKIDLTSCNRLMYGVAKDRYVDMKTDKNGYDNSIWEGVK